MKRFLLLLLVITMIVAGLAWATGNVLQSQAFPVRHGPGELAWAGQVAAISTVSGSYAAFEIAG